jgi:hypothetical protein
MPCQNPEFWINLGCCLTDISYSFSAIHKIKDRIFLVGRVRPNLLQIALHTSTSSREPWPSKRHRQFVFRSRSAASSISANKRVALRVKYSALRNTYSATKCVRFLFFGRNTQYVGCCGSLASILLYSVNLLQKTLEKRAAHRTNEDYSEDDFFERTTKTWLSSCALKSKNGRHQSLFDLLFKLLSSTILLNVSRARKTKYAHSII